MKTLVQSYAARALSSDALLNSKRGVAELKRKLTGQAHVVDVFLKVDDPYSYVLLQALAEFTQRFDAEYKFHIVSRLQDDMFPEPELWYKNAFTDAAYLADLYEYDFPEKAVQRDEELINNTAQVLLDLIGAGNFIYKALEVLKGYWFGEAAVYQSKGDTLKQLKRNDALLESMGHYLSATLHYNGEWYWGVDRLAHLEQRLINLGLVNKNALARVNYDQTKAHFCKRLELTDELTQRPDTPLVLYFSARSPYSYLGLERCVALARHYDIPLEVKLVLPMMMRNVLVPPTKKWYIFLDTKREAKLLNIDYGFVADPLGAAVERCYALYDYAKSAGREIEYLLSFARSVNAKGVQAETDAGLQTIVEQAGLDWSLAKPLLGNTEWRDQVEANFEEMHKLGLWGVPSIKYGDTAVWGQDRIDVIEQSISRAILEAN